jgi:hypothetical protein
MKRWKRIVGVVLLIVLGALGGSIATKAYMMRWFLLIGNSPQARTDFLMVKMKKELGLRPDQEGKIRDIIKQEEEAYQKKKRENIERTMEEVKKELDAEQQKKMEAWKVRYEKRTERIEGKYRRK